MVLLKSLDKYITKYQVNSKYRKDKNAIKKELKISPFDSSSNKISKFKNKLMYL